MPSARQVGEPSRGWALRRRGHGKLTHTMEIYARLDVAHHRLHCYQVGEMTEKVKRGNFP